MIKRKGDRANAIGCTRVRIEMPANCAGSIDFFQFNRSTREHQVRGEIPIKSHRRNQVRCVFDGRLMCFWVVQSVFVTKHVGLESLSHRQRPVAHHGIKSFNGVGLTPPMGWRYWKAFAAHISQEIMENMMDELMLNASAPSKAPPRRSPSWATSTAVRRAGRPLAKLHAHLR